MKPTIFISYSHSEAEWARSFAEELQKRGVSPWFDRWIIPAGGNISDSAAQGLRESETLVIIWGPKSTESANLYFELGAAVALNKRVIPVVSSRPEDVRLPVPLRHVQYITEESPAEAAEEVAKAVA